MEPQFVIVLCAYSVSSNKLEMAWALLLVKKSLGLNIVDKNELDAPPWDRLHQLPSGSTVMREILFEWI